MDSQVAKKISCSAKESIWKDFLFAVSVLSFCFVLAGAQTLLTNITVEPENPVDGGSVRLTPTSVPENTNTCRWYRGEESPQNIILEYFTHASPSFQWRDAYTGREDMDFKCSIEIKELKGIDSGTYMVTIVSADQTVKGKVDIVVSAPAPTLSGGPIAVIVIVVLALGLGLIGGLLYFFLRIRPRRRKHSLDPVQPATTTYENLPRLGQKAAEENPEVSSDPTSNVYEALQHQSPCVYEELRRP
ncbi:carcinoembryonic antigen-related cell adhesion molecule 6 [Anolis carolinensis]|uniref:carcinoembryonic antigen-related cell adhesion molecule 6 n=1 Tax=Anolis carolinensis TaxID=28377 RepID=UPI000462D642|nr:PREDICTED: carcinoembryonic antigen-related cell adhesion molecule 6 [Anolis carolinensis]|eukprot:XP_008120708.1 PREDICTED: carcinoembryonic antigen-related cell adhesion molecule 6 [Anolis carolinensis]